MCLDWACKWWQKCSPFQTSAGVGGNKEPRGPMPRVTTAFLPPLVRAGYQAGAQESEGFPTRQPSPQATAPKLPDQDGTEAKHMAFLGLR